MQYLKLRFQFQNLHSTLIKYKGLMIVQVVSFMKIFTFHSD